MKQVLITGANKGIGLEVAKQLSAKGYKLFLGSRNKANGETAVKKLTDEGFKNIELLVIDVADINSVKAARKELESKIGALDVLINNAGISGEQPQTFIDGDMDNLRRIYDTNFFGLIQTTQQFLPLLGKADSPEIINVSSELGSLAMHSAPTVHANWTNYNAYGSSKVAVNAFTVMLANQLKTTKIRVNSVTPGYTATDLNNHSGFKTASQGASVIADFVISNGKDLTGKFYRDAGEVEW